MVKIFADHCVHQDLILGLEKVGFKVATAAEVSHKQATDVEIFEYARKNKFCLLTFDRDFGDLRLFEVEKSFGIVIVEIDRMSKEMIIDRTIDFFSNTSVERLTGSLFIIQPSRVRGPICSNNR